MQHWTGLHCANHLWKLLTRGKLIKNLVKHHNHLSFGQILFLELLYIVFNLLSLKSHIFQAFLGLCFSLQAFCKSRNTPEKYFSLSFANLIFSVSSYRAWVVKWSCLNPNCFYITSFRYKNLVNLLWTSLSIILLMFERSEMGW